MKSILNFTVALFLSLLPQAAFAAGEVGSSCDAKVTLSGKTISVACIDNGCSKAGGACQTTNIGFVSLTPDQVNVTPACTCISKAKGKCTLGTDDEGALACGDNGCGADGGTCSLYYTTKGKTKTAQCGCDISPGKGVIGLTSATPKGF